MLLLRVTVEPALDVWAKMKILGSMNQDLV